MGLRARMRLLWIVGVAFVGLGAASCESPGGAGGAGPAAASRFALLAGASGETAEPNFFDEDFKDVARQLGARGWKVRVVAGGRDGLLPGSRKASNANLLAGVRETLAEAQPGQEALLVFHSHGREREGYWGQRSHSIVSEELDNSGVDIGFDLDAIEPELLAAKARGVRVALVDLSCYSGSTQAIQGTACTVSLAASRYVSLCSGRGEERLFDARFFKFPAAGTAISLEEQYLVARRADRESINLPRISSRATPALKAWEDLLVDVDPLDTFEDLKNLNTQTPKLDRKALLAELDAWIAGLGRAPATAAVVTQAGVLRAEIARKLDTLLALRKQLTERMPALAKDYDDATAAFEVPGRAPLKLGVGYLSELLQAAEDGQIPDGYTDVQRGLVKQLGPLRAPLLARYAPTLAQHRARREEFDRLTDELAKAAGTLFDSERRLYELQPAPSGEDPCRDFSL